jgi:hypothetical protein
MQDALDEKKNDPEAQSVAAAKGMTKATRTTGTKRESENMMEANGGKGEGEECEDVKTQ